MAISLLSEASSLTSTSGSTGEAIHWNCVDVRRNLVRVTGSKSSWFDHWSLISLTCLVVLVLSYAIFCTLHARFPGRYPSRWPSATLCESLPSRELKTKQMIISIFINGVSSFTFTITSPPPCYPRPPARPMLTSSARVHYLLMLLFGLDFRYFGRFFLARPDPPNSQSSEALKAPTW